MIIALSIWSIPTCRVDRRTSKPLDELGEAVMLARCPSLASGGRTNGRQKTEGHSVTQKAVEQTGICGGGNQTEWTELVNQVDVDRSKSLT